MDNRVSLVFQSNMDDVDEAVRRHHDDGRPRFISISNYFLFVVAALLLLVDLSLEGHASSRYIYRLSVPVLVGLYLLYFGLSLVKNVSDGVRRKAPLMTAVRDVPDMMQKVAMSPRHDGFLFVRGTV